MENDLGDFVCQIHASINSSFNCMKRDSFSHEWNGEKYSIILLHQFDALIMSSYVSFTSSACSFILVYYQPDNTTSKHFMLGLSAHIQWVFFSFLLNWIYTPRDMNEWAALRNWYVIFLCLLFISPFIVMTRDEDLNNIIK
jgi:hypothetical protein